MAKKKSSEMDQSLVSQMGEGAQTMNMVSPSMEMEQRVKMLELQEKDREIEAKIARLPEKERPKDLGYRSQMIKVRHGGQDEPEQPSLTARYVAKDYDKGKLGENARKRYENEMKWVKGKFFSLMDSKKIKNAVSCNISKWGISEDHTFVHGMTYCVRKFVADHLNSLKLMVVDQDMQNMGKDKRNGYEATNFAQAVGSHEDIYQFVIQDYVEGRPILTQDSQAPKRLIGIGA